MTPDQFLSALARSPHLARLFSQTADRLFPDKVATYRALLGPARGLRLHVNARSQTSLLFGTYENRNLHFLLSRLTPDGVFWDVGANVGYFTCVMARRLPRGRVIALEPLPANVQAIETNVALNRLGNVTLIAQALAAHVGEAHFVIAHDASMGYLAKAEATPEQSILVAVNTMDGLVQAGQPAPTLIKMDTEGAEGQIVAGATEILERHRPAWLVEVHTPEAAEQCWELFQAHRYRLSVLRGTQPVPAANPQAICWQHLWAEPLP